MREIFYYSQKHPINALNYSLIFPVYFVSSHARERGWLALGYAVDQALSWCWSAQLHPSPVKWGWLTPADSLAPYHLSTAGWAICYPFGALVSVCLTLEVHSAILIEFQWRDRHKLTWKCFCWGRSWLFGTSIVLIFTVLYSRLFPAAQQSAGAGAAQPVYNCQARPRGCNHHLPCTQTVILQDGAESLPILGQSSGLSSLLHHHHSWVTRKTSCWLMGAAFPSSRAGTRVLTSGFSLEIMTAPQQLWLSVVLLITEC